MLKVINVSGKLRLIVFAFLVLLISLPLLLFKSDLIDLFLYLKESFGPIFMILAFAFFLEIIFYLMITLNLLVTYLIRYPPVVLMNEQGSIVIYKNGEPIEKIDHSNIREVLFRDAIFYFSIELVCDTTGSGSTPYAIAEGYLWGMLSKPKRREEHKNKLKTLFAGIKLLERKKGKYEEFQYDE